MNKNLSLAIEKAVRNFPSKHEIKNIDNELVFNFESIGNTKKLVSTVDEILDHIKVTLGVIG